MQQPQDKNIPTEYRTFLEDALHLTSESDVNPSVVYPFLASQQATLNQDLIALIPAFATRNNIIGLLNFANLVQQFPLGQRAVNLEIAIAIYTRAFDFFDRQNYSTTWATLKNNLANAYSNRIRGERAENLERAIGCYEAALSIYTRSAYPEDWAMTQNNLANAYSNRIRGERAENLERAIGCYEAALSIYTRSAYPEQWAMTPINLVDGLVELFETSKKPQYLDQAFSRLKEFVTVNQKIVGSAPLVFYKLVKSMSQQDSYKQAIQTLERTLAILQEQSLHYDEKLQLMALTLFELARLSHKLLRLEYAKLYFKDALRLFRRLKDEDSVASVMTALGNLELQIGQSEAAQSHLESALLYYDS